MRRVARAGCEVQEERLLGVDRAQIAEKPDGTVGEIDGEVVAVGDRSRRDDAVVVVVERRDELVGLATVKAVPALEAPTERPRLGARPCGSRPPA